MPRYLPFLISLVLSIYALFSCVQTRDEDVPHLPKLLWIVLIVLVPIIGPVTWLLMARSHRRQKQAQGPARRGSAPYGGAPRRTTAPDDDPEFLAWLERNRNRRGPSKPPSPPEPEAGPDATDEADDDPEGPDADDDGEAGDRAPR